MRFLTWPLRLKPNLNRNRKIRKSYSFRIKPSETAGTLQAKTWNMKLKGWLMILRTYKVMGKSLSRKGSRDFPSTQALSLTNLWKWTRCRKTLKLLRVGQKAVTPRKGLSLLIKGNLKSHRRLNKEMKSRKRRGKCQSLRRSGSTLLRKILGKWTTALSIFNKKIQLT